MAMRSYAMRDTDGCVCAIRIVAQNRAMVFNKSQFLMAAKSTHTSANISRMFDTSDPQVLGWWLNKVLNNIFPPRVCQNEAELNEFRDVLDQMMSACWQEIAVDVVCR